MSDLAWQTLSRPDACDVLAPDGSEIRELATVTRGSMVHCLLRPGQATAAVAHRTVEELWYVLSGRGEMWRSADGVEQVVELGAHVSVSIPTGTAFQFRCTGDEPLEIVIVTMPPWPGADEAMPRQGTWSADTAAEP